MTSWPRRMRTEIINGQSSRLHPCASLALIAMSCNFQCDLQAKETSSYAWRITYIVSPTSNVSRQYNVSHEYRGMPGMSQLQGICPSKTLTSESSEYWKCLRPLNTRSPAKSAYLQVRWESFLTHKKGKKLP